MASPDRLLDEAVLHRIALSRYSTTVVRRAIAQLNRVDQDLVARILRADNEGRDPRQLERLLEEVRALQSDGWTVLRSRLTDDLNALAAVERDFAASMVRFGQQSAGLSVATNAPTTAQVIAAVNARPFAGRHVRTWLRDTEERAAVLVRDAVRQGFIEGQSVSDIVKRVRGSRALQYRDGLLERSRRSTETMVRTVMTHYANSAAQTTYEAMGVTQWRFLAVLDARTSPECFTLNGQTFDVGKGPQPPRHPNCRSTSIAVVEGMPKIDVPSYPEWFAQQSAETQDDILGKTKGRLYRSGGLTLDRFVDRNGKMLTLEQLKARDAGAFERIGLD